MAARRTPPSRTLSVPRCCKPPHRAAWAPGSAGPDRISIPGERVPQGLSAPMPCRCLTSPSRRSPVAAAKGPIVRRTIRWAERIEPWWLANRVAVDVPGPPVVIRAGTSFAIGRERAASMARANRSRTSTGAVPSDPVDRAVGPRPRCSAAPPSGQFQKCHCYPRAEHVRGNAVEKECRRRPGKLTISIDPKLAWGVWDHITHDDLRLAESAERPDLRPFAHRAVRARHQLRRPGRWSQAWLDEAEPRRPGRAPRRVAGSRPRTSSSALGPKSRVPAHEIRHAQRRQSIFRPGERPPPRPCARPSNSPGDIHRAHCLAVFDVLLFSRAALRHPPTWWPAAGLKTLLSSDGGWGPRTPPRASAAQRKTGPGRQSRRQACCRSRPGPAAASGGAPLIHVPIHAAESDATACAASSLPAVTRRQALRLRALPAARQARATSFHLWFFHPSPILYVRPARSNSPTLRGFSLARTQAESARGRIESAPWRVRNAQVERRERGDIWSEGNKKPGATTRAPRAQFAVSHFAITPDLKGATRTNRRPARRL